METNLTIHCFIQSGNQPHHKASFAFHAKKVKEALRAMLSGIKLLKQKYCFIKKIHMVKSTLNLRALAWYEN